VIKAALAHFWFVTIHPFDDGNGRIARAIADTMLARSEKSSQRFYSMSAQIQRERKTYHDVLERCQKGTLDITRRGNYLPKSSLDANVIHLTLPPVRRK
jgi:Fic family protein